MRDSEARLRAVVETAVDAIITIDDRGKVESVNPATERLFAYGRDEMLGRNVSMLMPDPYRWEHDSYLDRYLRTGEARIIGVGREVVGLRKDGSAFPLDLSVSEFRVDGRRMFTGILHDITNRRRLERAILEASANEQRRVGHELHDGLCQQLTGIAFSAELLARKLEAKAPEAVPQVRKLADEVDQAITQTRALARGLNPVEIHADGLASALDDLARKVAESYSVSCGFRREGDGEASVGDNSAATHLYRIAQEAISNAIRHGEAKKGRAEAAERRRRRLADGCGRRSGIQKGSGRARATGEVRRHRAADDGLPGEADQRHPRRAPGPPAGRRRHLLRPSRRAARRTLRRRRRVNRRPWVRSRQELRAEMSDVARTRLKSFSNNGHCSRGISRVCIRDSSCHRSAGGPRAAPSSRTTTRPTGYSCLATSCTSAGPISGRQHAADAAGGNRRPRHRETLRRHTVLRDDGAAMRPDRLHAVSAVSVKAREHRGEHPAA